MTRNMRNRLVALAAVCLTATGLKAESFKYVANVPFSFHAANTEMKAGKYIVNKQYGSSVEWIQSESGSIHRAVANGPTLCQKPGAPHLVFRRHGDDYVLAEIWSADGTGSRVIPWKGENPHRDSKASNGPDVVTVYLASLH